MTSDSVKRRNANTTTTSPNPDDTSQRCQCHHRLVQCHHSSHSPLRASASARGAIAIGVSHRSPRALQLWHSWRSGGTHGVLTAPDTPHSSPLPVCSLVVAETRRKTTRDEARRGDSRRGYSRRRRMSGPRCFLSVSEAPDGATRRIFFYTPPPNIR